MSEIDTDQKECPYCAELIKREAVKCKHCSSQINLKSDRSIELLTQISNHNLSMSDALGLGCLFLAFVFTLPTPFSIVVLPFAVGAGLAGWVQGNRWASGAGLLIVIWNVLHIWWRMSGQY